MESGLIFESGEMEELIGQDILIRTSSGCVVIGNLAKATKGYLKLTGKTHVFGAIIGAQPEWVIVPVKSIDYIHLKTSSRGIKTYTINRDEII